MTSAATLAGAGDAELDDAATFDGVTLDERAGLVAGVCGDVKRVTGQRDSPPLPERLRRRPALLA